MVTTEPQTPGATRTIHTERGDVCAVRMGGVGQKPDMAKVLEILAEFDKLPLVDDRSIDELVGYDEYGLPI